MTDLPLQRFDRDYSDKGYLRFGLVSGLTLLDAGDSYLDRERWSYPLLADNLRRWSDKPEADCAELFRRMVFNAVGLSAEEARAQIDRIVDVIRHWRDSFGACGVSRTDIDYIAPAILPACFFFETRSDR